MATRAKRGAAPTQPIVPLSKEKFVVLPSDKDVVTVKTLRQSYGLSKATFARMLGISRMALGQLESGKGTISVEKRRGLERIERILEKAAQAMRQQYVATWIEKPSPACAEIGAKAPVDLMERGDYDAVEDLLFFLGSGVPY